MKTLELVLNIVLVVVSVVMIIVVLLQKSKSSGLGAAFGGESASLSPKAKSASRDVVLQKITIVLAVLMAILALGLTVLSQFV